MSKRIPVTLSEIEARVTFSALKVWAEMIAEDLPHSGYTKQEHRAMVRASRKVEAAVVHPSGGEA